MPQVVSVTMTELTTTTSFIVRIYRYDTKDSHQLTGQVETMDGCNKREPFTNSDELAELLRRGAVKQGRRRKKTPAIPENSEDR